MFIIVLIYWLVGILGFFDFGSTEANADLDVDADLEIDAGLDGGDVSGVNPGFLTGLLLKFGLHGIPLTIILSFLIIFGWFFSFTTMQFVSDSLPAGPIGASAKIGVFLGALIVSAWLTGKCISPVRRFLHKNKEDTSSKRLCGSSAVVRSGTVSETSGQAVCVKDGYTFIVNVQSLPGDKELKKGDTAFILEHHPQTSTYTIVSEEKFKGI